MGGARKQTSAPKGEIVKYAESGMPQLEVWLEDETIWLTQKQMAEVFDCAVANVNMHLEHIYAEEELDEESTIKDFLIVRMEGKRQITRKVKHYNLDAIISVGYRVNSKRGVLFRRWATSVLKEYLLRGVVRDARMAKLETRMTAAERSIDTLVNLLVEPAPPPAPPRRKIGFDPDQKKGGR